MPGISSVVQLYCPPHKELRITKEIMQHYIEVFKIIKEEARKLLSK